MQAFLPEPLKKVYPKIALFHIVLKSVTAVIKYATIVRSDKSAGDGGIGEYFSWNSGTPTIDARSCRQIHVALL